MKRLVHSFFLLFTVLLSAQQSYYNGVNFELTGEALYNELQQLISQYNEDYTYGDYRTTLLTTDANPDNSSEVLLIYGFNDTDGDCTTDRTRDNDLFGGNNCEFNREHTFPRSQADPPMGSATNSATGIVADPHNLRPSDVQRNGARGSRSFTEGSGNSGPVGSNSWYPGDEWKGDAARIIMYMYLRYGDRCLPSFVGTGNTEGSTEMLQLFLAWNVEDPVSEMEEQRNPILENEYGNRNPFIDNPYLATAIWGGPAAEDIWGTLNTQEFKNNSISVYPNPANGIVHVTASLPINKITIFTVTGTEVYSTTPSTLTTALQIGTLAKGIYLMQLDNQVQKLVVN